jgi:hypothetical protein
MHGETPKMREQFPLAVIVAQMPKASQVPAGFHG